MIKLPAALRLIDRLPAAALALSLAACAVPGGEDITPFRPESYLGLIPTTFERVPGWSADKQSDALAVFVKSCDKLARLPAEQPMGERSELGRAAAWHTVCTLAAQIRPGNETEAQYFFESRFTPYRATDAGVTQGLFTGYYEPELRGAWRPDTTHRYPIYARPKDLVSVDLGRFRDEWKGRHIAGRVDDGAFVPYATREEINSGVLKGKQLELLWVDSAIDAFFMHIQGSGRIVMSDGAVVRVGYAGRNGHRYTPIGRELVAMGALSAKKVSLQTIQQWLEANPIAGTEIMERNKSYIFFRLVDGDGPVGAQGIPLSAGRSLAVDTAHIPLGTPIWLNTTTPAPGSKPLRRLVIAQDTGSAIIGPVRGDLFVGHGKEAGNFAGNMKQKGSYYLLLPKRPDS